MVRLSDLSSAFLIATLVIPPGFDNKGSQFVFEGSGGKKTIAQNGIIDIGSDNLPGLGLCGRAHANVHAMPCTSSKKKKNKSKLKKKKKAGHCSVHQVSSSRDSKFTASFDVRKKHGRGSIIHATGLRSPNQTIQHSGKVANQCSVACKEAAKLSPSVEVCAFMRKYALLGDPAVQQRLGGFTLRGPAARYACASCAGTARSSFWEPMRSHQRINLFDAETSYAAKGRIKRPKAKLARGCSENGLIRYLTRGIPPFSSPPRFLFALDAEREKPRRKGVYSLDGIAHR